MKPEQLSLERKELLDNLPKITRAVLQSMVQDLRNTNRISGQPKFLTAPEARVAIRKLAMNLYYTGYAPFLAGILPRNTNMIPTLEQLYTEIERVEFPQSILISLIEASILNGKNEQ